MIYIFPIDNHLLIIADADDALTSNESENNLEQEPWNSKRKEKVVFPPHFVEQIRRHFQSLIETPPQQRIPQKIFKKQVKKDELAVLKQNTVKQHFYRKFAQKERGIGQRKNSFFQICCHCIVFIQSLMTIKVIANNSL